MHYKKQYEELVNAMDLVGFTDEEEENLFSIIAGVLHLGNVIFGMDDNDASYVEEENGPIKMAAVRFLHLTFILQSNY
jgi:myosin heavy subunit